jgi:hypothetical protein
VLNIYIVHARQHNVIKGNKKFTKLYINGVAIIKRYDENIICDVDNIQISIS